MTPPLPVAASSFLVTLSDWGMPLIYFGGLIAFITSTLLVYRAFRESMGWGLVCVFFPLATLLFLVRFWREMKDIAHLQIIAVCMLISGLGLRLLVEENRNSYFQWVRSHARMEASPRGKQPGEGLARLEAEVAAQERAAALKEEKRQRAKELFQLTQTWYGELVKKQPTPGVPQDTIEAFNKEYANYQALLGEYKALTTEIQQPVKNSRVPGRGLQ
jgi:hypothetical protein